MFRLDNKIAVVTGAGSGIGQAIATTFAKQGARVFVLELNEAAGAETAARIRADGGTADVVACDVSSQASVDDGVRPRVHATPAASTFWSTTPASRTSAPSRRTTEADLDRIYNVNVKGVFLCSQAGIPKMVHHGGGVILNLASIASLIGLVDRFAYSMSKGAVLTMTRSIAVDYIKQGIRCNCVCPARVHTPFVDGYLQQHVSRPRRRDVQGAVGVPADRPHGGAGGGRRARALPVLGRGIVHHRAGVPDRRRRARVLSGVRR